MRFKTYLVGGAVRDRLMGVESNDNDFVVVGAVPADLEALGFKNVGESFPVFMDPETGDQYALARKERKTGRGYLGFSVEFDPSVTLADDLFRRDLTINAMALDLETGEVEDPYGGRADLESKTLRHVSEAFVEDPLRVVRLARFFARFTDFTVASETVELAVKLVDSGELDALADSRFWMEMEKAMEQSPEPMRFFDALWNFGVLTKVRFFKDLFGDVSHDRYFTQFKFFEHELTKTDPQFRLERFVAVVAGDAPMTSPSVPTWNKSLVKCMNDVRAMPASVQPAHVVELLNRWKAWNSEHPLLSSALKSMSFAERAGEQLVITSRNLWNCVEAGRTVTSEPYLNLVGPEIGKAMTAQRVKNVAEVMEG